MRTLKTVVLVFLCGLHGIVNTVLGADAALEFRSSGGCVEMGADLYTGLTNLTLSVWIKPSQKPAAGRYASIAGKGYLYPTNGFGLFLDSNAKIHFQTRNGDTAVTATADYVYDNRWHHVTGVREGDATRLYVDGVLMNEQMGELEIFDAPDFVFSLGSRYTGSSWGHNFLGSMAEVRLWNDSRSSEQIQDEMFGRSDSFESNLIGYWPLDDGAGLTVRDHSDGRKNGWFEGGGEIRWVADASVTALLPVSRELSYDGYWPFSLVDNTTGSQRLSDSTIVSIPELQMPDGYDLYQLSTSPLAAELVPAAWVNFETSSPITFEGAPAPAEGQKMVAYAWYSNSVGSVKLRRSVAAITYATIRTDSSLEFNGGSGRVEMAKGLFPTLTNLTLSAWIKTANAPPATTGAIAGRGYLSGIVSGFGLYLSSSGAVGFQTRDHDLSIVTASTDYPCDSGWHHVAGVRDGIVTRFYLDGTLADEKSGVITTLFSDKVAFALGARHDDSGWRFYFAGAIAEVQLWDHARAQDEIREDMFTCLNGSESGLRGYWPLREGRGSLVEDWSASGNDGQRTTATTWTVDVMYGTMFSSTRAFVGNWPIELADLESGHTRWTDSNVVAVAALPAPANCSHYQLSVSPSVSSIDSDKWIPVNAPPEAFTLTADPGRVYSYAWFTNMSTRVSLRRSAGTIVYLPVAAALELKNTSSARVVMSSENYPVLTDLTLSAWVKTSLAPSAGTYGAIAGRGYLYGYACGYGLFVCSSGDICFQTRTYDETILQARSPYPFDKAWHHLCGVRDGDDTRLYLDGSLVSEVNGTHSSLNAYDLAFGVGACDRREFGWNFFFDGVVADVRLWNRAFNEAQIQTDMFQCLSGDESGLIGYWPLTEGLGSKVTDRTDRGNDGLCMGDLVWRTGMNTRVSLPVSRNPSYEGYWPFALADVKSGRTSYTDSNVVAVPAFFYPAEYSEYQFSASPSVSMNDPTAWRAIHPAPERVELIEPDDGQPAYLFAWFTNTVSEVPLRRAGASIIYAPQSGPALDFSDLNTRVVMTSSSFPTLTNVTLELWIKTSIVPAGLSAIAGRGYLMTGNGFGLSLNNAGNLCFQTREELTTVTAIASFPFDGQWHHVAGVRDGDDTQLFIDGELVNTANGSLNSINQTELYFGFGARYYHGNASWNHPFNGQLAEARLWNIARSPEMIKRNRYYQLTGQEAGLVGYWPMDEGGGLWAKDRTVSGYDCRVISDTWVFTETFRRPLPPPGTLLLIR